VEKRDTLPLGSDARSLVDETDLRFPTPVERRIQVIDHEANVVDPGAAALDEATDGRFWGNSFEELDERVSSGETDDVGAIGLVEGYFGQSEDVAIEGEGVAERTHGDTDVRDAGARATIIFHVGLALRCGDDETNLASRGTAWNPVLNGRKGMSNSLAVTDATFGAEIEQHQGLAVVDFWATWCGPCRMIAPILDQLASEYNGKAKVAKVDVDTNQETATRFNVRSIPSILFFKDGKHVDTVVGAVPKSHLERKFAEHA
jgi:thioredoxin 1